ncbi:glycosyltransferase [Shimia sp.]|uniref:glycosyltransferase n=1 Tax=Shimia sp. TaxID=1954381 RepID=UPI003298A456
MSEPTPTHRKALVFCVNERDLSLALFASHRAATVSENRDFDILICSLDPLEIPEELSALNIRNLTLNLQETLENAEFTTSWLALVAYLRLWVPDYFRGTYDRILYTDADTWVATPDLTRLFDLDLGCHAVAGVMDRSQLGTPDQPVLDFQECQINCTKYLNSGVLLMDTAQWHKAGILDRALAAKHLHPSYTYHDQSLLNLALQGDFAELSPIWNWQWPHSHPRFTRTITPGILHFTGHPKPWIARKKKTTYDAHIIEAYHQFFQEFDLPQRFPTSSPQGHRNGLVNRAAFEARQLLDRPRLRQMMARYPDPWKAKV